VSANVAALTYDDRVLIVAISLWWTNKHIQKM